MTIKELECDLKRLNSNLYIKRNKDYNAAVMLRNGNYSDLEHDRLEDDPNVYKYKNGKTLTINGAHWDKSLMTIPAPSIYPQRFDCKQEPLAPDKDGNPRWLRHRSIKDVYKELKAMQLI